ncbi:UDP-glucose 4-epimerase [hydrothermal vent metagenome]|uniref:UDP-glucose 4-epimerase n=1 Tax=hydrothermal vent metagenome TaxID=652676 RepID=A0A1W1BHU5_9ZZZZ
MINVIIGRNSNLSKLLHKNIDHTHLISSQNIKRELDTLNFSDYQTINIIFNNFQISTKLGDLTSPSDYICRSITTTATVLEYIKRKSIKVNKIIYSSSSAVYGNNELCHESDPLQPLSLHSSLKIANEKLIEKFCNENRIDYTITRIFNMYGGDDHFSIISKIQDAYLNDKTLNIFNDGNATRDFIHICDVVEVYRTLLEHKINASILNLGRGINMSVANLLEFLEENGIKVKTKSRARNELRTSTANISKLLKIIGEREFIQIKDFLLEKIKES